MPWQLGSGSSEGLRTGGIAHCVLAIPPCGVLPSGPMPSSQPSPEPDLESLRSGEERVSAEAWARAYPLLRIAGMQVARARLAGRSHEHDREDIVATALGQMVRGIAEKRTKSFNRISSWDDCLRMMRSLTRSRLADFHRERYRNREDAVESLPEPEGAAVAEVVPFGPGMEDVFVEIDRLDPPMPELFRDRFVEGLTIDEIAERRDLNRNTLCTWFAKSLAILRTRLARQESDDWQATCKIPS